MSRKTVVHLGISGFPFGYAPIQRIRLVFKALKLGGFFPLIISKNSLHAKRDIKRIARYDGLPYVNTSRELRRPDNFFLRNLNKLSGIAGELILLFKIRKDVVAAILYTPSFHELVYYRILSGVLRFKLIIQYVEFRSSIDERKGSLTGVNDLLFDKYGYYFCDGIIVISEFLKEHVLSRSKKTPVLKIPAINDFTVRPSTRFERTEPYLMYCGTIDYLEVIQFVLQSFVDLKLNNQYQGRLVLIISGANTEKWERLRSHIGQIQFSEMIDVKSGIDYSDLLSLYDGADLLMIPLRDTIQDKARFPHKVGEYTASKRPILSTNLGEMKTYFRNGVSAILAEDYSVEEYVETMSKWLASGDLTTIGLNGYNVGMQNFHYARYANALVDFINSAI